MKEKHGERWSVNRHSLTILKSRDYMLAFRVPLTKSAKRALWGCIFSRVRAHEYGRTTREHARTHTTREHGRTTREHGRAHERERAHTSARASERARTSERAHTSAHERTSARASERASAHAHAHAHAHEHARASEHGRTRDLALAHALCFFSHGRRSRRPDRSGDPAAG